METLPTTRGRSGAIVYVTYQLRARTGSVHWRHIHALRVGSATGSTSAKTRGGTRPPDAVLKPSFAGISLPRVPTRIRLYTAEHDS
jgi:hypothetical protein